MKSCNALGIARRILSATLVVATWGSLEASAPAGNLYVSDGSTIHEFGPTGADLGTFVSTGLSSPRGLAFDSSGNLYVANGSTIHEFSPSGADLGTFASTGLSNSLLKYPETDQRLLFFQRFLYAF